jgi:hypothetical protein
MPEVYWPSQVAAMPKEIQEIAEFCWDDTGRPVFDLSYQIAVGRLLDLSKDYDTFCEKHRILFPNDKLPDTDKLGVYWHCYAKGIQRAAQFLA